MWLKEILATVGVVASLVGVPLLVQDHDDRVEASQAAGARIITLSGVADNGVWTLAAVNGTNYWWKTFERATLHVEQGQEVVLRLQSSDVHHRFYAPALGIGPVEVEPGHTELARFRADKAGTFRYYCTSICGDCHYFMAGWIVVTPKGQTPQAIGEPALAMDACPHDLEPPPRENMIEWGRHLYRKHGCTTCHGEGGKGGVVNFNYSKPTAPAHNTLAENFSLEEQEEAEAFVKLLLARTDLGKMKRHPDIPQFALVRIKYEAAKDLIVKGKHCAKRDKAGPEPPLQMQSWREVLNDDDIDSIIAYLLTLYPWDEEDEE